ncbi:MAG: hypothetical protein NVS3B16_17730 [Vulcanimicrobiaceae bacterium]
MSQAPDLRTSVPRPGRERLGGYVMLGRVIDKVRAMHAGTEGEYLGYCPLSLAFLRETGIARDDFDALLRGGADDGAIVAHFDRHVAAAKRDAANEHLLAAYARHFDEQDAEEGVRA